MDPKRGETQPMPSGESLFPLLQAYVALRLTLEKSFVYPVDSQEGPKHFITEEGRMFLKR